MAFRNDNDDEGTTRKQQQQQHRELFQQHNQGHVWDCYDSLVRSGKQNEAQGLWEQIKDIPVESLSSWVQTALQKEQEETVELEPYSGAVEFSSQLTAEQKRHYWNLGVQAVQRQEVACVLLAGGQGTRLGYDGPKGMYPFLAKTGGENNETTLFSLICGRIRKLQQLASSLPASPAPTIPLWVMTSPMNHETTKSYFAAKNNFGLADVVFFPQGTLPCVSSDDASQPKILMASPSQVAVAPDGNGGVYTALYKHGLLSSSSVKYIHMFAVDNCLVKPADPVFIGHCLAQRADAGLKVVWKREATEKVGVLAQGPRIVEYSELSTALAEQVRNEDGRLVFGAGNICNHFFSMDFCRRLSQNLPYHLARKKIPVWNGTETATPESNNGFKLESFVFDVLEYSEKFAVLDVPREEEFAPVKNATGNDSPEDAARFLAERSHQWLKRAGVSSSGFNEKDLYELDSYDGEGLGTPKE